MTTRNQSADRDDEFTLPLDLSEWVDECKLLGWIEEAVEGLEWNHPDLVDYLRRNPAYRPKMLLTLLAFAYATGVFGSEDISRECNTEPLFKAICENRAPTATEVSRFRRENRGLLKGMLVPALTQAAREKYELGDFLVPPGLKRSFVQNAVERLDLARHTDSVEV